MSVVSFFCFPHCRAVFVCIPFRDETLDAEHEHDSQCGSGEDEEEDEEDDVQAGLISQGALD